MKKIAAAALLSLLFSAGCATVDQNIQARKDLEKCRFEITGIEFVKFHKSAKDAFEVELNADLEITNPNENDVALDHVDADIYVEQSKAATVQHRNFVRIKAKSSVTEKVGITIPMQASWLTGARPDTATIDALVYVNVLIGSFTLPTPIEVPVKKIVPIPWDRIEKEAKAAVLKKLFR